MKEHPILFSAPMVRAILEGSKTQTRRVVNARWLPVVEKVLAANGEWVFSTLDYDLTTPYGEPGDRLWVRETWYCDHCFAGDLVASRSGYVGKPPSDDALMTEWRRELYFRADGEPNFEASEGGFWRPSIHMPRWASRITLEVTGVRVERLNDISEPDSQREGIDIGCSYVGRCNSSRCPAHSSGLTHRADFIGLWESINGAGSWKANPWVWVVEFKRLDAKSEAA